MHSFPLPYGMIISPSMIGRFVVHNSQYGLQIYLIGSGKSLVYNTVQTLTRLIVSDWYLCCGLKCLHREEDEKAAQDAIDEVGKK